MVALFASPDKDKYKYFENAFKINASDTEQTVALKTAFNEVFVRFKNGQGKDETLDDLRKAISWYDTTQPKYQSTHWTIEYRACDEVITVMKSLIPTFNTYYHWYIDEGSFTTHIKKNNGAPFFYIENITNNQIIENYKLTGIIINNNVKKHYTCYYLCKNQWYCYDGIYPVFNDTPEKDIETTKLIEPVNLSENQTIIDYITSNTQNANDIIYALIYDKNEPIQPIS
jgi:hypothetical protein